MSRGLCTCDDEHMFDCSSHATTSDSDRDLDPHRDPHRDLDRDLDHGQEELTSDVERQAFDDVLDRILGEKVCKLPQ